MVAFQELFTAPTVRHFFSLALAAFIDIVVFLLAYASGPYFFGSAEQRWFTAVAALDSRHDQVFVRDFLRKLRADPSGLTRAEAADLTPGETQLCCLLVSKNLATTGERDGRVVYLLSPEIHEQLLEALSSNDLHVRASVTDPAHG